MVPNLDQGPKDPGAVCADGRILIGARPMSDVARVTEIARSTDSSRTPSAPGGSERARQTLRGVTSAWVKEQQVKAEHDRIVKYQVNLAVTFALEEHDHRSSGHEGARVVPGTANRALAAAVVAALGTEPTQAMRCERASAASEDGADDERGDDEHEDDDPQTVVALRAELEDRTQQELM
ncbi:MAG TPA: dodecin family protein [Acidimicrobiales bacterium]|nr:dodecin family protein [Acidimicrobiales bacterium]